jgi:hypothetical protein
MTDDKQLKNLILTNFVSLLLICLIISFNPQYKGIMMILESVLHLKWTSIILLICGLVFSITFIILLLVLEDIITQTIRNIKYSFGIYSDKFYELRSEISPTFRMIFLMYIAFVVVLLIIMWKSLLALAVIIAIIFALLR